MTEVVDVYGALRDPFPENDIGWRIGRSGAKDGDPWAMCLAYITNRAIQTRLDTRDLVHPLPAGATGRGALGPRSPNGRPR